MRRADRLFRIVQLLRHGRLLTAGRLAEKLKVSTRTIYRDVMDLQLSGAPIEGEPGVGYTLRRDFDLPPLMFTSNELTALVLGARLVQAWGGAESVLAAGSALQRIEAVLPAELRDRLDAIQMYAPGFMMPQEHRLRLDQLHAACLASRRIEFSYIREDGQASRRPARPLGLYFWTGVWTLVAWCELRTNFRTFRLDRMSDLADDLGPFTPRKGQRLKDYVASVDRADKQSAAPRIPKKA
jgi:predicted DNA-binding transcriptional regulator YafY